MLMIGCQDDWVSACRSVYVAGVKCRGRKSWGDWAKDEGRFVEGICIWQTSYPK